MARSHRRVEPVLVGGAQLLRDDDLHRLPDRLLRRETEQLLRLLVPPADDAVDVDDDDAVARLLQGGGGEIQVELGSRLVGHARGPLVFAPAGPRRMGSPEAVCCFWSLVGPTTAVKGGSVFLVTFLSRIATGRDHHRPVDQRSRTQFAQPLPQHSRSGDLRS
ncbi:hypothetical protein SDC9_184132 [bioreactor metagenome]|uniref:Uncharacterized protein n=1 Tax=bioreactor metagenome TaxID=1076179 RepID=A0A645HE30_9ZZZZ